MTIYRNGKSGFEELAEHQDALDDIRRRARKGKVTIAYGAKDAEHNSAVALVEYLKRDRQPTGRSML
ncbi:MAG: DUF488 family protein [Phycisphaerae bacterium]|nr:DUF488 family protein [Phycisphaerae bacterium]